MGKMAQPPKKELLIVLYGISNQGKTSTLKELILMLANGGVYLNPALVYRMNNMFPPKGKNKDGRFVVKYRGKLIFIATGGDSWSISLGNTKFFECVFSSSMSIFKINKTDIKKMDDNDIADIKKRKPDICICACNPGSECTGAIKALHMYCEIPYDYSYQLWIQKDATMDNNTIAIEIKTIIDNYIKNNGRI